MGTQDIRAAIERSVEYLRAHPDEARSTDSLATARVVDGLVVRVSGPAGETLTTDMVPSVGGSASAPSPGWLLRAAEASCVATLIAMRAAMLGITLSESEVSVDSESDDRGILAIDDGVPAGPLSTRVAVRLAADGVDDASLAEIARWGIAHCPVHDAVERAVPMTREIITGS
ncbi:OsmC family protein [soil metagenome]